MCSEQGKNLLRMWRNLAHTLPNQPTRSSTCDSLGGRPRHSAHQFAAGRPSKCVAPQRSAASGAWDGQCLLWLGSSTNNLLQRSINWMNCVIFLCFCNSSRKCVVQKHATVASLHYLEASKNLQVKDPQVLRSLGIDHLGYRQIQPDYPMPADTNLNCGQRFNKCQEGTSQFHPNNWDMRLCWQNN